MARVFVYSDNLAARVELVQDSADGRWAAFCAGCPTSPRAQDDNLLHDTHEQFVFEDAVEVAGIHVDRCTRCADADCRTEGRHDASHRCRKN